MPALRIKAAARADLKGIARYTQQTWGREQRNRYLTEMDQTFVRLAENPELGEACDRVRAGYRIFPVGNHRIFYRLGADKAVEIIRILHKRMDVLSRM
jgi:toxin ParE1/3/4